MSRDPERQCRHAEFRFAEEFGFGEVEGEEDEIPEEILACADFVEGDEGEGLSEHAGGYVVFCEGERDGDDGEEELGEEGEGFEGEGGVNGAGG